MKNLFSVVICFLVSVFWQGATAQQWIIDGQRVQSLEIHVSDPQAVYTDGSRQMTAPLSFASSLTETGGLFRTYIPWSEQTADIFQLDGDDECIKLSSDPNVSFQVGGISITMSGLSGFGASVGFEDNTLFGPWKLNQVADNNSALLNRSYADSRYMRVASPATQSLTFAQSLTETNGALQLYAKDSELHLGYFKSLSFQDGLQFSTDQSATLLFGEPADGLMVGPSTIMQTGYGARIDFETGALTGSAGMKWHVNENPTEELGIVNKGYADGRYLLRTNGITTNRVIQAGNTLVISNGLITTILP